MMRGRVDRGGACGLGAVAGTAVIVGALLTVVVASPAGAEWHGTLALSWLDQSLSGSEGAFRSHTGLDSGVALEGLDLHWRGTETDGARFDLALSGFGNAEPWRRARLEWALASPWKLSLRYDRRESFFALGDGELSTRRDDWDTTRVRGEITYDGWKAARLSLDLRRTERDGTLDRPLLGLNELFPITVQLDETMSEAALRLETKGLPVRLVFEQAFATYRRENRRSAAGTSSTNPEDAEVFRAASSASRDEVDVPTTRLVATYANRRLELVASGLYAPAELDAPGLVSSTFGIGGGELGTVEFLDDVLGSADMDTTAADLRLSFVLAPSWRLRLTGHRRERSTDALLLGQKILRVTSPFGDVFDFPGSIDESTVFDVTEEEATAEIEWRQGAWQVWAGGRTESRDTSWRLGTDAEAFAVDREADGTVFGVAYRQGRKLAASAEYETGTFDRFVFRTQPEDVERLTLRLRSELGHGWSARLRGRFENADNPAEQSALDRSSDSVSFGLGWASSDGEHGFGLDLDSSDLSTDTALLLPDGSPGLSVYDLSLLTTTVHGRTAFGKARLSGSVTRLDDSGQTWPVEAWTITSRLGFALSEALEIALYGQYWEYDEDRAQLDDYDVTRYGLGLRWRFDR